MLSRLSRVRLLVTLWSSLPAFSVRGILQVRILEWVTLSSSRGSSRPKDGTCITCVSCSGRQFFCSLVFYHYCHLGSPLLLIKQCNLKSFNIIQRSYWALTIKEDTLCFLTALLLQTEVHPSKQ